jgi:hypothetical protein
MSHLWCLEKSLDANHPQKHVISMLHVHFDIYLLIKRHKSSIYECYAQIMFSISNMSFVTHKHGCLMKQIQTLSLNITRLKNTYFEKLIKLNFN